MQGRHKSIATELFTKLTPPPYKLFVASIANNDALTLEEFNTTRWSAYYTADMSNLVRNGKPNPNHLFEIFGKFNGKSAVEVRMLLLRHIESNMEFYEWRSVVCLNEKSMRFDGWIESIGNEQTYCDELALIGLCALYGRHCLVFTKNKFWSSLDTTAPTGFMQLLQKCSVKLIFLGDLKFGVLNWNPRPPKPVKRKSTEVPRFSIVEEYTLDDSPPETTPIDLTKRNNVLPVVTPPKTVPQHPSTTATDQSLDTFSQKELCALPVETFPITPTDLDCVNLPLTSTPESSSTVKTPVACVKVLLPVGTDPPTAECECSDSSISCPEDDLVLSQYPWKKSAVIKIDRLSELSIDLWCNKIPSYYEFTPVKPVESADVLKTEPPSTEDNNSTSKETSPSNYDAETDVDIDNLLQHAKSLVRKVKEELTPENETLNTSASSATKRKHKEHLITPNSKKKKCESNSHVETPAKSPSAVKKKSTPKSHVGTAALDALHQQTLAKLKPIGNAPNPVKRERVIKCRLCTKSFPTT